MTSVPLFAQLPITGHALCTSANTTWTDSPDDTTFLISVGASGGLISRLTCVPRATATATFAAIYHSASGGSVKTLVEGKTVAADTVSVTDAPTLVQFSPTEDVPWRLAPGDMLFCGIAVALADGFTFRAEGANF